MSTGHKNVLQDHFRSWVYCLAKPATSGVGRYVGFTPMWERTTCGFRAGELDISPVRGIGNTRTRLHSYG